MPYIQHSAYRSPLRLLRNKHLETIIPSMFGKEFDLNYQRERITTPDDDFLDIDWVKTGSSRLVIISHGLEGNSYRPYVRSMANYLSQRGFDICAWNYRSCSEEMNRNLRLYHHGVSDDLETVVQHGVSQEYTQITLVGFSMGGSTTLKYLGEVGENHPQQLVAAAVFSVPCNLWNSAEELTKSSNSIYRKRFLKKLINRIKRKAEQYPNDIDLTGIDDIESFSEFDERYTAPLHHFKDAKDFYESSTSDQFYHRIKVPSLIVNALNDPMLGDLCYPVELCKTHPHLHLQTPKTGGHVGFNLTGKNYNWMDVRAGEFIEEFVNPEHR